MLATDLHDLEDQFKAPDALRMKNSRERVEA